MEIPVEITDRARKEIVEIKLHKKIPSDYGLRITLDASGCSGVNYRLGFDKKGDEDDVFLLDDVPVYIKRKDFMYLVGVKLDFVETDSEQGFVFV